MKLTEYLPTLSLYRAVPVTVQFQYNPIYTYKISYKTEFLFSSHFSTPRSKKKKKKKVKNRTKLKILLFTVHMPWPERRQCQLRRLGV